MKWLWGLCIFVAALVQAKAELTVLTGLDKPPYIMLNSNSGYELELLKLLTKKMGYDVVFLHVPNARIINLMLEGKADIATLQKEEPDSPLLYSRPYISYQNVAVSRADRGIQLSQLAQLTPYRVVAFHNARFLLGQDFQQITTQISSYQEVANQRQQLQMLMLERCDVVLMDRNILRYYATEAGHSPQLYTEAALFSPSLYSAAFINKKLRDKFNQALAELQQEPAFIQLQLKYFSAVDQQLQPAVP
jgi:polar amino acid transport system substrate-binding protein